MKFKLAISLVLALLAFVFITQNTETVQVRVLLWSIEMSLVLLVFIMLAAGAIIGWFLNSYLRFASRRQQNKAQQGTSVKKTLAKDEAFPENEETKSRHEQ